MIIVECKIRVRYNLFYDNGGKRAHKEWVALTVANQQHLYYRLAKAVSPLVYTREGDDSTHNRLDGVFYPLTMPQYLFNERKSLNESVTAVINSLLALLLLLNNYPTLKPKDYLY